MLEIRKTEVGGERYLIFDTDKQRYVPGRSTPLGVKCLEFLTREQAERYVQEKSNG